MEFAALNPFFSLMPLFAACVAAWLIRKVDIAPQSSMRCTPIDGLRGYLALSVFLHHSAIWYFYLRGEPWQVPPSRLYTHVGQSSVALFFMITGFLFTTKIINAKETPIDWIRLYVSRVFRLTPLYVFAMAVLFLLVAIDTQFELREPPFFLARNLIRWMSFTILGHPDLNGVEHTSKILAGVTWSLPYEWFFYLLLPVLAAVLQRSVPRIFIAMGLCAGYATWLWEPVYSIVALFLGGIAAAFIVQCPSVVQHALKPRSALMALCAIVFTVIGFDSAFSAAPIVLLSIAFMIIAAGNSIFGILTHPISRTLGNMAYSIYLLHGIVLFVTFKYILGYAAAATLTPMAHWAVISLCSAVVVAVSFATYRTIELPAMRKIDSVSKQIQRRVNRSTGKQA